MEAVWLVPAMWMSLAPHLVRARVRWLDAGLSRFAARSPARQARRRMSGEEDAVNRRWLLAVLAVLILAATGNFFLYPRSGPPYPQWVESPPAKEIRPLCRRNGVKGPVGWPVG